MKRVCLTISGRVQGVWFRASAKNKADELGIKGLVRNESNRTLYIEAEGPDETLQSFIAWCHTGPKHAQVTEVKETLAEPLGFVSFEIDY